MFISKKNSKLGNICNISLPPVVSCGNSKYCAKKCYARKAYRMYPNVRSAWNANYDLAKRNQILYFSMIDNYIKIHNVKLFRWHVSGDILNQSYLNGMIFVANCNPNTKFLAFTKMYHLKYKDAPKNLTIVFSCWPKLELPKNNKFLKAWYQDGIETRVPLNAIHCRGKCDSCLTCFYLNKYKKDVVFKAH